MSAPEIHFRVPTDRALNPDDNVLNTGTCHVDVAVVIDPTMTLLGEHQPGFGGDTIRIKRWDEQVLLHELLHVAVSRSGWWNDPQRQINDPNGHDVISRVEVALWETGWRLGGAEAVEAARSEERSKYPGTFAEAYMAGCGDGRDEAQAAERALVARIEAHQRRMTLFADGRARIYSSPPSDDDFNKGIRHAVDDLRAALASSHNPEPLTDVLRREAQRRTEHGYVHHATVRNLMRKLADHMDAMAEFGSGRAALSPDAEGER